MFVIFPIFICFRRHIHEQGEITFRIRFLKGDKNPEDQYEFADDRFVVGLDGNLNYRGFRYTYIF